MGKKKKNDRVNVVYSTNPDFEYEDEGTEEEETLSINQQVLYVEIDRKQRKGKEVTLVTGFVGTTEDLNALGKTLKSKCGVGGTTKDSEILIQGNCREKVIAYLQKEGYQTKRKGG